MPLSDLPREQLEAFQPLVQEETDFDTFWSEEISEAIQEGSEPTFEHFPCHLAAVKAFDVVFSGYGGHPIRGWLLTPSEEAWPVPLVVEFLGYGEGRGLPYERLLWSAAGYAHFVMDTRGQGSQGSEGGTFDPGDPGAPSVPGFATKGINDAHTYYYLRLIVDAVLSVEAIRTHRGVRPDRVAVMGGSQGGGVALAVCHLAQGITAVMSDVPFMSHPRRAVDLTDRGPYEEISRYCATHSTVVDQVFRTLSYVDAVNHAKRATAPALFSVGLYDDICPPSTVYAAFNWYLGEKSLEVYPHAGHEGGRARHVSKKLAFAERHLLGEK